MATKVPGGAQWGGCVKTAWKPEAWAAGGPIIMLGLGSSHMAEWIHLQVSLESSKSAHSHAQFSQPHSWAIIRLLLSLIGKVCWALSVNKFIVYNCCYAKNHFSFFLGGHLGCKQSSNIAGSREMDNEWGTNALNPTHPRLSGSIIQANYTCNSLSRKSTLLTHLPN